MAFDLFCTKNVYEWLKDSKIAAISEYLCAFVCGANRIILRKLFGDESCEIEFVGHRRQIHKLSFSADISPSHLLSFGEDHIMVWTIQEVFYNFSSGSEIVGKKFNYLSVAPYDSIVTSFNENENIFAICLGSQVEIMKLENVSSQVFNHHNGSVNDACFISGTRLLISVSDDRSFNIYDCIANVLMFKSAYLCASPLSSVSFHPTLNEFLVTAYDGHVFKFCFDENYYPRQIGNFLFSEIAVQNDASDKSCVGESFSTGTMCASKEFYFSIQKTKILALSDNEMLTTLTENQGDIHSNIIMCVFQFQRLTILNYKTFDCLCTIPFPDVNGGISNDTEMFAVTTTSYHSLIAGFYFPNKLLFMEFLIGAEPSQLSSLNVIADASVLPSSILFKKWNEKRKQKASSSPKKKSVQDKPLTFHTKIKSSGYNVNPSRERTMFKPVLSTKPTRNSQQKRQSISICLEKKDYFTEQLIPFEKSFEATKKVENTPSQVSHLSIANSGVYLSCCSGNKSCYLLNNKSLSEKHVLVGHNGSVTCSSWSLDDKWLATASRDKVCKLWDVSSGKCVLSIEDFSEKNKGVSSFKSDINFVNFYFLDEFLIFASGKDVFIFKYVLDTSKCDIKRYESRSKCKLVKRVPFPDASSVTHLQCANRFYSYIFLCALSNNRIVAYDLNHERRATEFSKPHTRAPHFLAMNLGSDVTSFGNHLHNLFASAACTDGVKIWDIRVEKPVVKLHSHVNKSTSVPIQFSPCGNFIACGSEDRSAFLYDFRKAEVLGKTTMLSDVVSALAFHPVVPKLYCGTNDGSISVFRASTA